MSERKSPPFEGGEAAPKAQTGVVFQATIILTTPPARKTRRRPSFKRRPLRKAGNKRNSPPKLGGVAASGSEQTGWF